MKFHYRVISLHGISQDIELEAVDAPSSLRMLKKMGYTMLKELNPARENHATSWYKPAKKFDVKNFADQLSPLLEANIPLEKALSVIEEGSVAAHELAVIGKLRQGLHEGKRFSTLIREDSRNFPSLFSSLIEGGEESGCLAQVTRELRRFLKESKDFKSFVITSSIYPAIVIAVTLIVLILMFTVFVPRFAKIFDEMGREMPFLTRAMLNIGSVFQAVWWIWPLLIIFSIWAIKKFHTHPTFQYHQAKILLMLPILHEVVISIEMSRFIRTLSIMLKNQVKVLTAIGVSKKIFSNVIIANDFAKLESDLSRGERLSEIFRKSRYMPQGSVAMLKIAEESGDLGEMLERIALEQEERTRIKVQRLLAFLEPIIILILAFVVLLVVLSIFMAITEMNVIK